jgi:hypothetical protein
MKYLSITVDHRPTDCGCSPFHPTIGSEAFILSTLATPVPSHDITRELLQFLRDSLFSAIPHRLSLSLSSARFIRCSLSIKLVIFCSGHVFCKFSEILSLVLSSNQNNLSSFQFFFSAGEPHMLFLFSSAYLGRAFPSWVCLLLVFLRVYSCMPFSSSGRFWTCHVPSVRRKLGSVWACRKNCPLWYFGLTVFCLPSQTLHASIHWGS